MLCEFTIIMISLFQVLEALKYLHTSHIAHRDLKASNVLIKFFCACENPLVCSCEVKYQVSVCVHVTCTCIFAKLLYRNTKISTIYIIRKYGSWSLDILDRFLHVFVQLSEPIV